MRFLIGLFLILSLSWADSSYERGKTLYMQKGCYSCHGTQAEGMHMYPRLANRAKGYLTYKLNKFKNKESDNQQQEMMIAFAVNLSEQDIDDLTTFFTDFVAEVNSESYDDSYEEHGDGGS